MTHRRLQGFLVAFLTLTCTFLPVHPGGACRIIVPPWPWPPHPHPIPHPPPPPQLRPMDVTSHKAHIEIKDRVAKVTVDAVFHNPNSRQIEGVYVFPISRTATVSSFAMTVNGKTIEAELLDADKARKTYEDIVRKLKDPALLEYMDDGLLRARVFPIEANKDVAVQLCYEQLLTRDGSLSRFRYPLLSAKPGGEKNAIKSVVVQVDVESKTGLKTVFTPGFESDTTKGDGNTATITFEATDYMPDKDFEVMFSESRDKVGIDMLTAQRDGEGYFAMFIAPDSKLQEKEIAAKNITFVVDTSGSMAGDKIKQVRSALTFCIEQLGKKDAFNILTFATDVDRFADQALPATDDNKAKARAFIDALKARGGTAIDEALRTVLELDRPKETLSMTVFLTDGLPTIGTTDIDEIMTRLKGGTPVRFFTFGVGYDVNTRLLDGISQRSAGFPTYVRPGENLELSLTGFYERIASPVMTNLELASGDVKLKQLHPARLPDLFRGTQVILTGRYTGKGKETMSLTGEVDGKTEKFPFDANLDGDSAYAFIPRMWAIRRVAFLMDELKANGHNDELVNEIKTLGREYGIVTPHTSFLIVEEAVEEHARVQLGRHLREAEANFMAADSGKAAVDGARGMGRMRQGAPGGADVGGFAPTVMAATRSASGRETKIEDAVRTVHDKTFYFRRSEGTWYDAAIPRGSAPENIVEIEAWSDQFFELAAKHAELRKYMLAGNKIVVELDSAIYRIR